MLRVTPLCSTYPQMSNLKMIHFAHMTLYDIYLLRFTSISRLAAADAWAVRRVEERLMGRTQLSHVWYVTFGCASSAEALRQHSFVSKRYFLPIILATISAVY
jgi:hypothetical protein